MKKPGRDKPGDAGGASWFFSSLVTIVHRMSTQEICCTLRGLVGNRPLTNAAIVG